MITGRAGDCIVFHDATATIGGSGARVDMALRSRCATPGKKGRLASKIRNLQQLLDDPDLHSIALDEEDADDPVDLDVDLQDLVDLVSELEGRSSEQDDE